MDDMTQMLDIENNEKDHWPAGDTKVNLKFATGVTGERHDEDRLRDIENFNKKTWTEPEIGTLISSLQEAEAELKEDIKTSSRLARDRLRDNVEIEMGFEFKHCGDVDEHGVYIPYPSRTAVPEVLVPTRAEIERNRRAERRRLAALQAVNVNAASARPVDAASAPRLVVDGVGGERPVKQEEIEVKVKSEQSDNFDLGSSSFSAAKHITIGTSEEVEMDGKVYDMVDIEYSKTMTDEEMKECFARLSNPRAKIKRDFAFDYVTVLDRLKFIGTERFPIDLDEVTRNHTFNRYYISGLYGGGTVETFPRVDKNKASVHGIDNFCFASLDFNPHAPVNPGDPGLFFEAGRAESPIPEKRTFIRLSPGNWLYCGTYQFIPSESLTSEEFGRQSAKVQRRWAQDIKAKGWGLDIVVRVYLRAAHQREPTIQEVDSAMEDGSVVRKAKNTVMEEQIVQAFGLGEEESCKLYTCLAFQRLIVIVREQELGVYCMKCVAYDPAWQQIHVQNYPPWERAYKERVEQNRKKAKNKQQRPGNGKRKKVTAPRPGRDINADAGMGSELSALSSLEDLHSGAHSVDEEAVMTRSRSKRRRTQAHEEAQEKTEVEVIEID